MNDAVIRRVLDSDFDVYQALMLACVRTHPDRFRLTEDDILAELPPIGADDPDGFTLGAFLEDKLCGVISVAREKREKLRHKALLSRMYVVEQNAGRGLGQQLLAEAVKQARGLAGVRHLNLTVLSQNLHAKRLYTKAGFVQFALEPGSVHAQDRDWDEEQMKLILS